MVEASNASCPEEFQDYKGHQEGIELNFKSYGVIFQSVRVCTLQSFSVFPFLLVIDGVSEPLCELNINCFLY